MIRVKKDCLGCRAKNSRFSCGLDYELKPLDIVENGKIIGMATIPAEPCPKPKTYTQLLNTQKKRAPLKMPHNIKLFLFSISHT